LGEQRMLQPRWNSATDFIIRVDHKTDGIFQGKIEHVQSGQVHLFRDFMEMLLLIQGKLDRLGCPQAETELRCWPD
jgi:hypothetical protein